MMGIIFFVSIGILFTLVYYNSNPVIKSLKLTDVMQTFFASFLMSILIILPGLRKIILIDNIHFILRTILYKREYGHTDINEIIFQSFLGAEIFTILMKDRKKMRISSATWSAAYYKTLKGYFVMNNPEKVIYQSVNV